MGIEEQAMGLMAPLAEAIGSVFAFLQTYLGSNVMNLLILAAAIALYAIIVGMFYKRLSKRELFTRPLGNRGQQMPGGFSRLIAAIWQLIKYAIIFPIITFLWFLFLATFLFFLSRTHTVENVLVISIAVVIAIRIAAYIDEDISVDLAKMLPLGMLGVFLVDPTVFSKDLLVERLTELARLIPVSLSYFYVMILFELFLKVTRAVKRFLFGGAPDVPQK
ncbi:MAG: hypothetical protein ABH863_00810 [Candidatus Micrarchaeota archaeon]